MGQRLNIEIVYGENSLANCYYHWDAYSFDSLKIAQKVVEAYSIHKTFYPIGIKIVVKILETTGAGITEEERFRIDCEPTHKFSNIRFNDAVGRNEGLISVTENGKDSTRSWEEGRITIDILSEMFFFDVYYQLERSEYEEEYDNGIPFDELKDCQYDFSVGIPFSEIDNLLYFIIDNPQPMHYHGNVILWIS